MRYTFIFLFFVSAYPMTAFSKDCDCNEHDAGASGSGTCTLTESSSYCQINYTASSSNSRATQNGFDLREMNDLVLGEFESEIPIEETFRFLNDRIFFQFSEKDFLDVVINTIVLSASSSSEARDILDGFEIEPQSFRIASTVEEMFGDFSSTGCAETLIGTSDGDFRYLIIHARSELNGRCNR